MHLADAFIQSDLHCVQAIHIFVSMCVPREWNPQYFALLTQCSTTEPQGQLVEDIGTRSIARCRLTVGEEVVKKWTTSHSSGNEYVEFFKSTMIPDVLKNSSPYTTEKAKSQSLMT